jgi:hypothetical protein
MKRRSWVIPFLVVSVLFMPACGGGGSPTPPPNNVVPPPQTFLTINPATLPAATRGVAYDFMDFSVIGAGATSPFTYSVSGQVPPGMALTQDSNGLLRLSGNPTTAGTFNFTVTVRDGGSRTGSRDYLFTVDSRFTIITSQLPTGVADRPYDATLQSVNGTEALNWTGAVPAGLSLDSASGRITGTPQVTGNLSIAVTATDSSSPVQSAQRGVGIRIVSQLAVQDGVSTLFRMRSGVVSANLTGGQSPFTASFTGSLPPGMRGSSPTGAIVGMPTQNGDYTVTVTVTDSVVPAQTANGSITVRVRERPPSIVNKQLPKAVVGQPYAVTLAVDGGTRPFTWRPSTNLPPGLSFSNGILSGTPTQSGLFLGFSMAFDDSETPPRIGSTSLPLFVVPSSSGRNDSIATATPLQDFTSLTGSLSPYTTSSGTDSPDVDYYRAIANGGANVSVSVSNLLQFPSPLDPVIEILDSTGNRFTACKNEGTNDGVTGAPDPTPNAFDDVCLNDDRNLGFDRNAFLEFAVPGSGPQTFYIRVTDFRGDARPEYLYSIVATGLN